jgi:hypothetical protein
MRDHSTFPRLVEGGPDSPAPTLAPPPLPGRSSGWSGAIATRFILRGRCHEQEGRTIAASFDYDEAAMYIRLQGFVTDDDEPRTLVPRALLDRREINRIDRWLAEQLLIHARDEHSPTDEMLARWIARRVPTVRASLNRLERLGWLRLDPDPSEPSGRTIVFTLPEDFDLDAGLYNHNGSD